MLGESPLFIVQPLSISTPPLPRSDQVGGSAASADDQTRGEPFPTSVATARGLVVRLPKQRQGIGGGSRVMDDQTNNKPPTFNGDLANLPPALAPMKAKPNWVMWKWEFKKRKMDQGAIPTRRWQRVDHQTADLEQL